MRGSGWFEGVEGVVADVFDGGEVDEVEGFVEGAAVGDEGDEAGGDAGFAVAGDVASECVFVLCDHGVDECGEEFASGKVGDIFFGYDGFDFSHEGLPPDSVFFYES